MRNQVSFDLEQLCVNEQAAPTQTWLLLGPHAVLPETAPFLLSISPKHREACSLMHAGLASSLEQAAQFFDSALKGHVAAAILPRVVNHLNTTQNLAAASALTEEQQVFGQQFEDETPTQGLQGFLQKRATRFSLDSKSRQELQRVLTWLEAQL